MHGLPFLKVSINCVVSGCLMFGVAQPGGARPYRETQALLGHLWEGQECARRVSAFEAQQPGFTFTWVFHSSHLSLSLSSFTLISKNKNSSHSLSFDSRQLTQS